MPVLDPPVSVLPGAINESFLLGDLELNEEVALSMLVDCFGIKELHLPPPPEVAEYVKGDRDGSNLVRPPLYDNREITGILWSAAPTRDLAHDRLGEVIDRLQEAKQLSDVGLPTIWTPRRSTKGLTFYTLSGALGEINQSVEAGYFLDRPILEAPFTLTCKPFGYGDEIGTVTDTFDTTDSLDNYTYDTGSGWTVSGGKLVPTSSSTKRIYYNALGYRPADLQFTIRYRTGASVGGGADVRISKRIDANNRLVCIVANAGLVIRTVTAGVQSGDLGTTAAPTLSTNTDYWLRLQVSGNKVRAEHWTSAPTPTGTPAAVATYTLSGAAATLFGLGQPGDFGFSPSLNGTDWTFDEFTFEPNVARGTDPTVEMLLPHVPGDVPAEGKLIVTDIAGKDRRFVEWGLENRYASTLPLLIDSPSLVTSGFSGSSTSVGGAYGGTVISGGFGTTPVAICGLGNLGHVGSFRVKARVIASVGSYLRLSWKEGDGPFRANPWQGGRVGLFFEVDLGEVTIPEARRGTQRWTGKIEAMGPVTLDYIRLVPAEAYGKARGISIYETPQLFTAQDAFDQSAGNLNGKTLPVGGSWATSGAATDFAINATDHTVERSANDAGIDAGRFALAGTTTLGAIIAQVDVMVDVLPAIDSSLGVVVRYIDANNWALARLYLSRGFTPLRQVALTLNVAGVITTVGFNTGQTFNSPLTPYTVRLYIDAEGRFAIWVNGSLIATGSDTNLATGGALATGKFGIYDANISAGVTRTYDNFSAAPPVNEPALFSGQSVEFRHDGEQRADATGAYFGPLPSYRGSEFFVPPSGSEDRMTRLVVRAARNDLEQYEDATLDDPLQAQCVVRPRYLQVPR